MHSLLFLLAANAVVQAQVYNVPRYVPLSDDLPPLPTLTKRRQMDEPCSQVSELWAAQQAQGDSAATPVPIRVPAELAYQCLQSVPVDVDGDVQEIQELKAYLQYQSTLAYLKTGVDGLRSPLDIMGTLDEIAAAAENGTFTSDFEVQFAIRALLDDAHDFHLQYFTDLTNIFSFSRIGGILVSLSDNGLSLPKIYLRDDILQARNSSFKPSAVVSINGINASQYLEQYSSGDIYHDVDARYNNVFYNPAQGALGTSSGGLFFSTYGYDGANTTLNFANGTSKTIDNVAYIGSQYDFSTVKDGPSFFEAFCQGPQELQDSAGPTATPAMNATSSTTVPTATSTSSPGLVGYPQPVFVQDSRRFSGYYLNESNYKDVAVLAIPGFDPSVTSTNSSLDPNTAGFVQTQKLLRTFFANSMTLGKKKLVIDLRGNGGGTIDLGFELFKQLFPTMEPYGATRYRDHEAFQYYSASLADLAVNQTASGDDFPATPLLWSNILDANRKLYKSFGDYYGPYIIHNDTFTGLRRYNFSNNNGGHTLSVSLTGYNEQPTPPQPFQAQNIILIQDGFCGSTCAIFSELMREQGKVQTIAIGGRPQNAPMQGVGGSKGAQVLDLDAINTWANNTLEVAQALDGPWVANTLLDTTAVGQILNATQIYKRSAPNPTGKLLGGVNSLSNYRQNDSSNTPLEFIYEAADCRLFYTKDSFLSPVPLWKQVVDAKWGTGNGTGKCVNGSTGDPSAIGVLTNQTFQAKSKSSSTPQSSLSSAASTMGVSGLLSLFAAVVAMVLVV